MRCIPFCDLIIRHFLKPIALSSTFQTDELLPQGVTLKSGDNIGPKDVVYGARHETAAVRKN